MTEAQSVIERMALAILASHDITTNDKEEGDMMEWDALSRDWKDVYLAMARAAIEAMREPTIAMKAAGGLKCEAMMFEGEGTGLIFEDMGTVFTAMIDAELSANYQGAATMVETKTTPSGWNYPIETAPAGVLLDVWHKGGRYTDVEIDRFGRWIRKEGVIPRELANKPTHWRYPPPSPECN